MAQDCQSQESTLKREILSEKSKEDSQCNICDKVFSQKGYLKQHILNVHGGEKNYNCEKCEATFQTKCVTTEVASTSNNL